MTDSEYDLLEKLGFQCERLSCLCALLDMFESTAPFSYANSDPAAQHEERLYAIRLLSGICDLARYYSCDFHQTLSSIQL